MNSASNTHDVTLRDASWPEDEQRLHGIRSTVFVDEQRVPRHIEWDGQDAQARHVLAERDGVPVGCGRLLADGRIGRLAVLAACRGEGIGFQMLMHLIGAAQRQGLSSVYLHAQSNAVAFYQRAGFIGRGEPFDEAGISHLDMHRLLDYRDFDLPLSGLRYPEPFRQLVVAQARLAGRELRILSPRLDARVFDQEQLAAAMRGLLRRGRSSRIQILVSDARSIVQRGHGLLQLARRLPSGIEMRRVSDHPDWDGDTQVLRDRDSVLTQPASELDPGSYRPGDRARCEAALQRFEEIWRVAEVDPEFRALSL